MIVFILSRVLIGITLFVACMFFIRFSIWLYARMEAWMDTYKRATILIIEKEGKWYSHASNGLYMWEEKPTEEDARRVHGKHDSVDYLEYTTETSKL